MSFPETVEVNVLAALPGSSYRSDDRNAVGSIINIASISGLRGEPEVLSTASQKPLIMRPTWAIEIRKA